MTTQERIDRVRRLPPKKLKLTMNRSEYTQNRIDLGLTQAQLAEKLGVQQATISMRESGKSKIKREHVLAALALKEELKRQ